MKDNLWEQLASVGYEPVYIRLSDLMREVCDEHPIWFCFPERADPDYYERAMDCGNKLRKDLRRPHAVAALAMLSIRRRRDKNAGNLPPKRAYILSSLKRREEITFLRDVFGASLFVISAYSPRSSRVDRLASQLAERQNQNRTAAHRPHAEELILRDEEEAGEFGQDVRKTYPLGDLFVDASSSGGSAKAIERFVSLIFGDPWKTPSRDEQGMAFASLASLRSGSPARQVGAAVTTASGELVAVGVNEVASPRGEQYWEGDTGDGRDFIYDRVDTSDRMRRNLIADVLRRLSDLDALSDNVHDPSSLLKEGTESFKKLRDAQLFDTIDFVRAVHAEASALFSAGRRAKGSTLYVTTFPCHECARHIVISGVKKVVYVEPYPKSLVAELYRDSINLDQDNECPGKVQFVPFTGISPTIYQQLFSLTNKQRKAKDGTLIMWNAKTAEPRLHVFFSERAIETAETDLLGRFETVLNEFWADLKRKGGENDSISGASGEGMAENRP